MDRQGRSLCLPISRYRPRSHDSLQGSQRYDHSDLFHSVVPYPYRMGIPPPPAPIPIGTQVTLPLAFLCTPTSACTQTQRDMMAHAISAMDTMAESLCAVSIVEEALQKASGMRAPIRCFGCDGIPEFTSNCLHLWRDCPNKNDLARMGKLPAEPADLARKEKERQPTAIPISVQLAHTRIPQSNHTDHDRRHRKSSHPIVRPEGPISNPGERHRAD
jgi:hypothetical protein